MEWADCAMQSAFLFEKIAISYVYVGFSLSKASIVETRFIFSRKINDLMIINWGD